VHALTISIDYAGEQTEDTRGFTLLPLPPHISFITPLEGQTIGNALKIGVSLNTQGEAVIQRVAFAVNGIEVGADETKPYELDLDARQYPIGVLTITAIAYDANNTELARSSVNLFHAEATPVAQLIPTEVAPMAATPVVEEASSPIIYMAILLSGLSIITIGLLLFFLVRQQKQAKIRDVETYIDNPLTSMQGIPIYRKVEENREENRKATNSEPESEALGALTIEASDDPSLVGHRIEITASLITLGRSADNDIIFPNDKPVSRHHAEIYLISDKLYLREVETPDSSGAAKPPKYGTFLNQGPMGPDPALLKTGDEIQLGKRVRLRFESYTRDGDAAALTSDDLSAEDDLDRTQES
jgi:pSer/pThr/pTyr-binding forkhead associated (FHA) protein